MREHRASIATGLFRNGGIHDLAKNHVTSFYRDRARDTVNAFRKELDGLPYRIHKPEGAFFLWLWFQDLPLSCQALYERLKARGVLVVPGHHSFFGLKEDWPHRDECIRVSYVQEADRVREGVRIIADEVREIYSGL